MSINFSVVTLLYEIQAPPEIAIQRYHRILRIVKLLFKKEKKLILRWTNIHMKCIYKDMWNVYMYT